jgi:hypothetical protein
VVEISGLGGSDVGTFRTNVSIPAPIQVTTGLEPETVISVVRPFKVTWTNGSPDAVVRMRLVGYTRGRDVAQYCDCTVLASDGQATLPLQRYSPGTGLPDFYSLPVRETEFAEVIITVTPLAVKGQTFVAPGLTRAARHEWSYEYDFTDLKIR